MNTPLPVSRSFWLVNRPSLRSLPCLMALTLLLFLPSLSQAATRKVPSQYGTIQGAIDAAVSGDTVLVADGTYTGDGNRDLDFLGKSLTVKSEHGPTKTILDCQATQDAPHRGFYIYQDESVIAIDGFTVENGYGGSEGGGVYIDGSNPGPVTLTNCVFENNRAGVGTSEGAGGGVYIYGSGRTVTLSGCTFADNSAFISGSTSQGYGGGTTIIGFFLTIVVDRCTFSNNSASGDHASGGGAYLQSFDGTVTVSNTAFTNANTANGSSDSQGGGLYINSDNSTVSHTSFVSNVASGSNASGGGAYLFDRGGTVQMTDCAFRENSASAEGISDGGGAYLEGSSLTTTVERCSFQSNAARCNVQPASGGGLFIGEKSVATKVTNCSFSGNQLAGDDNYGGGVCIDGNVGSGSGVGAGSVTLGNCSFFGNMNTNGAFGEGGGCQVYNRTGFVRVINCIAWSDVGFTHELYLVTDSASTVGVTYSDVQGGYAGTGNLDIDPMFVNAANGDLHLQLASPCLSVGTHTSAPPTDLDGNTRPNPPSMGAFDIPFALKSLTFSPSSIYGGETTTGTITLTRPAPAGGSIVTLYSNTGYAPVSSPVMFAAGQTSKTFTLTSKPVTATKAATLTVGYNGVQRAATLLIYAPVLKYLTLSPTTVKGGKQNSVATVTLTSPAPAGGTLVTLSSNTGYANVPGSILVPAGGRVAAFTVTTRPVTAYKGATITATQGGVSKSVGLLLTP